jgi:hypothetical protein
LHAVIPGEQALQVQRRAQILEQQQAARLVGFVHVRDVRAECLQHSRHLQVGAHVLLVGRGIHHHVGRIRAKDAKVTPEARIARGRLDARHRQVKIAREPGMDQRESRVVLEHR